LKAKHDHNERYSKREVCEEKHRGVDAEFAHVKCDVKQNTEDIKGINRKITATLVFTIVSLATLVTAIILRLL